MSTIYYINRKYNQELLNLQIFGQSRAHGLRSFGIRVILCIKPVGEEKNFEKDKKDRNFNY